MSEAEAVALRPALDALITEFRRKASGLVALLEETEFVDYDGATWWAYEHGAHRRFENRTTGEVVEAGIDDADALDPYFLLEYGETSGRHDAVREACAEGFHDMRRLLKGRN